MKRIHLSSVLPSKLLYIDFSKKGNLKVLLLSFCLDLKFGIGFGKIHQSWGRGSCKKGAHKITAVKLKAFFLSRDIFDIETEQKKEEKETILSNKKHPGMDFV